MSDRVYTAYFCWNEGGSIPNKRHASEGDARKEAERIAARTGNRVHVLKSVAVAQRREVPIEFVPFEDQPPHILVDGDDELSGG